LCGLCDPDCSVPFERCRRTALSPPSPAALVRRSADELRGSIFVGSREQCRKLINHYGDEVLNVYEV